jgi:drug/metabolite transporter (DMT)-like permease
VQAPQGASEKRRPQWWAYAALTAAVAGVVWSAFFVRWADVPGPTSAFYRVLIAACALIPWSAARWSVRPPRGTKGRRATWTVAVYALAGGALFALDLALYNTAVLRTTAANATLFGNNAPLFVGLGTWLILRRPPGRAFWVGLALALAGSVVVMVYGARDGGGNGGDTTGNLLALAAALFFAGYLLTTERAREEMDTVTFSAVAAAGSVITLLVTCRLMGSPLAGFSGRTWAALLGLGLISQLGSYLALAYALGHLPATVTSIGLLAQVPLTAMLAVPLLGERLTAAQMAGGVLVLAGIFIVSRREERAQSTRADA